MLDVFKFLLQVSQDKRVVGEMVAEFIAKQNLSQKPKLSVFSNSSTFMATTKRNLEHLSKAEIPQTYKAAIFIATASGSR